MACKVCQKTFVLSTEEEYDSDTKPHVCSTCGQSFSLKIQLKRHTLLHANGDPFTCINCSKDCEEDDDSKSYNLRLTKKGDYTCELCNLTFTSKRSLLRHTNDEHTFSSPYFCDDCPEMFETASDLKKHSATHKSKSVSKKRGPKREFGEVSKTLTCPTCDKTFAYQACLDKHVNKCGSEDSAKSSKKKSYHDDSSSSKPSKKSYVEVYENTDKKHECNICGKSFTRKSALDGHLAIHLKDEYDSFDEDGFANEKEDRDSEEPKDEKLSIKKSFVCIKCNFVCFSRLTLVKHVCRNDSPAKNAEDKKGDSGAKGKENKNYDCSKCSKSFDSPEELKEHKSTHSKDTEKSKVVCEICDKVFSSEKRLKRHLESHKIDNNKNEDSDIEEVFQKFRRRGGKRKGKDYTCDVCGKRFAGETCLRKHARKHEDGETPRVKRRKKNKTIETLVCSYCDEEFVGKKNQYLKHMHIHTPEVCGICDERFENRQQLREHCKVHVGTEEGRMFMECSQKALDAKNGLLPPEPKVEYIYLVLR